MREIFLVPLAIKQIVITCPLVKEGCKPDEKKTLKEPSKESQIREGEEVGPTFTCSPRKERKKKRKICYDP